MAKPHDPSTARMVQLMAHLAPLEGYNLSALDDVRFLRSNRPLTRTPVLYEPGIVILCQGRKRGYLGDDVYIYDAQHYLVVSVPVPFTMETDASEAEPMLAVYLRLDFTLAGELIEQVDQTRGFSAAEPMGMYASAMDEPLRQSTLRFLEIMSEATDAAILGPAMLREIYYRIITGEQGGTLRAAISQQQNHPRHSQNPQRLPPTPERRNAGPRSPNERAQLSPALSQSDRRLTHAIPQIHPPAPSALTHATQRPERRQNRLSGRLRKPLAIQPRLQTPLRPHAPGGSGLDETHLRPAGADIAFGICVIALISGAVPRQLLAKVCRP